MKGTRGKGLCVKKGLRAGKLENWRRRPVQPVFAMMGLPIWSSVPEEGSVWLGRFQQGQGGGEMRIGVREKFKTIR